MTEGDWGLGTRAWGDSGSRVVGEPNAGGTIQSYEDLRVWSLGIRLAEAFDQTTKSFPDDERLDLISQLRRAAVSISSDIAQGWGRGSRADYRRFVSPRPRVTVRSGDAVALGSRFGFLNGEPMPISGARLKR